MRWEVHISGIGKKRNAYRVLVEKPGGERPLGRSGSRWADIMIDLKEIELGSIDWIRLAQGRYPRQVLVNMARKLQIP
jgi:hypothetical protein